MAFLITAGATTSGSGSSAVNVEPTAEIPRAVTALNSTLESSSPLESESIPASSSTHRGGCGSS